MQTNQGEAVERPLLTIAIPTYNRSGFLRQLLDSLVDQLIEQTQVELLISDNASQDDTAETVEIARRLGDRFAYVRNVDNIGSDGNFLQCYERATGKYVWIVGDDDLLLPGSVSTVLSYLSKDEFELVFVSPIGFSGDPSTLKPKRSKKPPLVCNHASQFLRRVHIFTTLISCNIVNKDRVREIGHQPFAKLVNSNLIQLGWTFTALRGHRKSLLIEDELVSYRLGNTGGYGVCKVFGSTLFEVTREWLGIPPLNALVLNASLQRLLPACLLAANQKSHGSYLQENPHALLSPIFRDNIRYWIFDYPLIVLPSGPAWLWLQMLRVVNRLDRAFGLPSLGG